MTVAADLSRALGLHQGGRLAEAEALYRRVLAQAPKHGEALHYLGLLKAQMGDFESALELAGAAVKADPRSAQAHLGLGHLRAATGQPEAALQSYDQALAFRPDYPEALYSQGNALQGLKRHEEAVASYDRLLALSPDVPEVLTNRGNALHDLKRYGEALASYDRALTRLPGVAMLHNNRGNTLREMKRFAEALASLDRALALEPGYVEALINRGNVLQDLGRYEEALACFDAVLKRQPDHVAVLRYHGDVLCELRRYQDALSSYDRAMLLEPDNVETLNSRGIALCAAGRPLDALENYDRVLAMQPDHGEAWTNKGLAFHELKRYEEALAAYEQSLGIQPGNAKAWTNKGFTLSELKRYDEALAACDRALGIQADAAEAHHNLAHLYLSLMQFDKGWEKYEWRWLIKNFSSPRLATQKPLWDGGGSGERLLVWDEQGIGDQILYGSLLGDLREFPQKKIISVDPRLIPLFRRVFPEYEYPDGFPEAGKLDYDFQIPMGSLGRYFRHSPRDFSKGVYPYLKADEALAARIRHQTRKESRLLCGLSWNSRNKNVGDDKSLSLLNLLPILSLKNCQFVDLQYGDTRIERSLLEEKFGISIHGVDGIDNYSNIDGLAAIIQACDLVVTVSNTTAHLAGALGRKTLLLLPFSRGRFWYWHHINGRSLWYPSVSVFEQPAPGNWAAPITQIESTLKTESWVGEI